MTPASHSVLLYISEARDVGDVDRSQFYDHMKAYTAAPAGRAACQREEFTRVTQRTKLRRHRYHVNHKADGIYLPADDRRSPPVEARWIMRCVLP